MCPAGKAGVTGEDAYTSLVHLALAEDDLLVTGGRGEVPKTQPHLKFHLSVFLETEPTRAEGRPCSV